MKISDKHSNLRLKFEHPIVLNPEKKYKLGVSHLLFSFDKIYSINMLLDWYIPIPGTQTSVTVRDSIVGDCTINSLKKEWQRMFDEGFAELIEQNKRYKKVDIVKKLRKIEVNPVKFGLKRVNDDEYVVVLNFPFKLKILTDIDKGFCKFFRFENVFKTVLCLHQIQIILRIILKTVYKEISKEIMFIPLRKGLREIREIILTPLDVNGEDIKELKDDAVYLQLKEE